MMEFWVTLTLSEHGRDEDSGVRLLEAVEGLSPAMAPVAEQNLEDGRLSIVLSIQARDAAEAIERGRPVLGAALERAGLPMTRLIGVEASPVAVGEETAPAA